MGNRAKGGRRKPKSIKTKAANLNSKRKLAKHGKEQKKGHAGNAIQFMSRTRAVKYLQITLRDFRRLCILKGIYPRDPKRKPNGKDKTYYHVKDISYLAHEPLLNKFREFKVFMKKVRKRLAKKEHGDANKMYDKRPQYTLDHLVRERYPRFADAVGDLDDALSLLHLFASLPSEKAIRVERTSNAERLIREWQYYVSKSRSLRKSFVSIKGIYYEAEIQGQKVVWMVPHKFSQDLPTDVDFRVMLTFLEFYETLLSFVLFKLFHSIGLSYPPKLVSGKDEGGEHLGALAAEALEDEMRVEEVEDDEESSDAEEAMKDESDEEEEEEQPRKKSKTEKQSEERIKSLEKKMAKIENEPEDKEVTAAMERENDDDDDDDEEFAQDDEVKALKAHQREVNALTNLFKGLTFFLGREVPFEPLEFIIISLGGKVKRQDVDKEDDSSITHQITDRPAISNKFSSREYIQPQWIFDSINNNLLMPIELYTIGTKLPPHLSPFVDDEAEGHVPTFAADIKKLKQMQSAASNKDSLSKELIQEPEEEDESSEEEEDEEEKYNRELKKELKGESIEDAEESEEESEEEEEDEPEEKPAKKQKKEKVEETKKDPIFIASKKFKGKNQGYIFKNGSKGLGYYKDRKRKITFTGYSGISKRKQRQQDAQAEKERREMMMGKKAKRLYGRMQHGINKKKKAVENLKRKRDAAEGKRKSPKKSKN